MDNIEPSEEETPLWLKALYYIVPTFGTSGLLYMFRFFMKGILYKRTTKIGGKIVLITGIDSEIGKETAIDLAKRDGKIYISCKDPQKGESALKEIKKKSDRDNIHYLQLDLSSMESIRQFSRKFHENENKLDILINNHEVFACQKSKSVDGFEMHMGVNVLGHFLLTKLLLDLLKQSSGRIIFESCIGYRWGTINKEDFMSENSYGRFKAYCNSKLAIHLLANQLSKKLNGSGVTVNISFPGFVISDVIRRISGVGRTQQVLEWIGAKFVNTAMEGAQTTIYASVDEDLKNVTGKFFDNCKEIEISVNDELSAWMYNKNEELIGNQNV